MRRLSGLVVMLLCVPGFALGAQSTSAANQRYRICLAKAHSTPSVAYEDALIWQNEGGAGPARHCVAMALLGLRAYGDAAQKLEELAYAPDIGDTVLRNQVLMQSGEAWLQADRPEDALRVLDLVLDSENPPAGAHTNRARALMALDRPTAAHADLDTSLKQHPEDALALRLRAAVLLYENKLMAAKTDIDAALRFDPASVDALLVRGQIREAIRTR